MIRDLTALSVLMVIRVQRLVASGYMLACSHGNRRASTWFMNSDSIASVPAAPCRAGPRSPEIRLLGWIRVEVS